MSPAAAPVCLRSPVTTPGAYRALLPNGRLTRRHREGRVSGSKTIADTELLPPLPGLLRDRRHARGRPRRRRAGRPRPPRLAGLHVPQGAGARRAPSPSAAARRAAPAPQRPPRAGVVGGAARRPRAEAAGGRSTSTGLPRSGRTSARPRSSTRTSTGPGRGSSSGSARRPSSPRGRSTLPRIRSCGG